ncbi:MAG: hypothetical protein KDA72_22090, partial [Planctomycetales bacterium]|nr:hypothetical protein [Planctomycetales bacterium]
MPFRSSNTMTMVAALWLSSCLFTLSLAQTPRSELFAELARVADGQTDAAPILQKLIHSRPGHLQLPPGTYRLERTVEIDLAQTGYLSLTGSSASQLVMSGAGPALRFKGSHFKSADPPGFSEQVWDQERMPVVKGI